MWTNRKQHAEALGNNSVGYVKIKPDPMEYRSADGRVNPQKKVSLVEDFLRTIHRHFSPARVTISYPGDAEFSIIFMRPVEGETLLQMLDKLAQEPRAETGAPYSFWLSNWAMKDPEAIAMGTMVEVSE